MTVDCDRNHKKLPKASVIDSKHVAVNKQEQDAIDLSTSVCQQLSDQLSPVYFQFERQL